MVSAVTCMSLRRVWHLCNLPCVYALFRLISIARYALKSPRNCFWGTNYEIYREQVASYLHSILWRRAQLSVSGSLSRISYLLLVILAPHDSNVAVYAQVCWLFRVFYMPLFGLVQARPWFRSSMWISSVTGISKMICMSLIVTSATRTDVRMWDTNLF